MSLRPAEIAPVPAATVQVARAAFPKGCPAMRMRNELSAIYDDQMFAAAYPARVRVCGLRRSRYAGLAKTHLQHVATAAALNVVRFNAWVQGEAGAATRTSRLVRFMVA